MEITFHAKVVTAITSFYTNPNEKIIEFDQYVIDNVGKQINNIIQETVRILNCVILRDNFKYNESSVIFRPKSINKKLLSILNNIKEQFSNTGIHIYIFIYIYIHEIHN